MRVGLKNPTLLCRESNLFPLHPNISINSVGKTRIYPDKATILVTLPSNSNAVYRATGGKRKVTVNF